MVIGSAKGLVGSKEMQSSKQGTVSLDLLNLLQSKTTPIPPISKFPFGKPFKILLLI